MSQVYNSISFAARIGVHKFSVNVQLTLCHTIKCTFILEMQECAEEQSNVLYILCERINYILVLSSRDF